MALTLLQLVNRAAKRSKRTGGPSGTFTSLTDTAQQHVVDEMVNNINSVIQEIYSLSTKPMPKETAPGTITLETGTREYDLASDLEQIHWPLINETNGAFVEEYPVRKNGLSPSCKCG